MGRSAHDAAARVREYSLAMHDLEPIFTEIAHLLDRAERDDEPARIERTLTDGYARALSLEAEQSRLRRRIELLTARLGRDNVSGASELPSLVRRLEVCDVTLERLRNELVRLRRRHSLAVRADGLSQTSPDLTA